MNSKNLVLFIVFLSLFTISQILYLKNKSQYKNTKKLFVKVIGLPDLAISTEAKYVRHRSLTTIGAIFSENPESIEYFPTTFVYAPFPILKGYQ